MLEKREDGEQGRLESSIGKKCVRRIRWRRGERWILAFILKVLKVVESNNKISSMPYIFFCTCPLAFFRDVSQMALLLVAIMLAVANAISLNEVTSDLERMLPELLLAEIQPVMQSVNGKLWDGLSENMHLKVYEAVVASIIKASVLIIVAAVTIILAPITNR